MNNIKNNIIYRINHDLCSLSFFGVVFVSAIGDENEGNESRTHREEVRQHVCCARHERMIDVGYGKQI